MTPSQIGRYRILAEIHRSWLATVYRGEDPRTGEGVVVKVLAAEFLSDPTVRARFPLETQLVASLNSPAIVPVLDFSEQDGQLYIVMPFLSGGSLADRLREGPLPPQEAISIIQRLASALDSVHEIGLLHGDLKPSNILFDEHGQPWLSDFGMLKFAQSAAAAFPGALVGPPAYASPEQLAGEGMLGAASDIYMLGGLLFHMLTGRLPYKAETPFGYAVYQQVLPPTSLAGAALPRGFETVILRAMAKNPQERYQSAAEMATALAQLSRLSPVKLTPVKLPIPDVISDTPLVPQVVVRARPPKKPRSRLFRALAGFFNFMAGLLLLGVIVFSGWYVLWQMQFASSNPLLLLFTPSLTASLSPTLTPQLASATPVPTRTVLATPTLTSPPPVPLSAAFATPTSPGDLVTPEPTSDPALVNGSQYTVQSGDTLFSIASRFHTSLFDLFDLNSRRCGDNPVPGESLSIPLPLSPTPPSAQSALTLLNVGQFTVHTTLQCPQVVADVAVSADRSRLVIASGNSAYLWQYAEADTTGMQWKPLAHLRGHLSGVTCVAISPDGKWVATGGEDNVVRLYSALDGDLVKPLYGHRRAVTDLAFSSNNLSLASAAFGDIVKIWNVNDGTLVGEIAEPQALSVAYSPDSTLLAVGKPDSAELYNALGRTRLHNFSSRDPVRRLAFSPDGMLLASSSDVWHVTELRPIYHLQSSGDDLAFSPDGQVLLTGNRSWWVSNGQELSLFTDPFSAEPARQDERNHISLSGDGGLLVWGNQGGLSLWSLPAGAPVSSPPTSTLYIAQEGDTLFSISNQFQVKVAALLAENNFTCTNPIFTGQHVRIPTASQAQFASVEIPLAALTPQNIAQLEWLLDLDMACVAQTGELVFDPQGKTLVSGSAIWDTQSGAILVQASQVMDLNVPLLVLSPDGHTLAMRFGQDILFWDIHTGHPLDKLSCKSGPVSAVAFTPDGSSLAAACSIGEGALRVWRLSDGNPVWQVGGLLVQDLQFTADGSTLIARSEGALRIYQIPNTWSTYDVLGIDARSDFFPELMQVAYVVCLQWSGSRCTAEVVRMYDLVADENLLPLFQGLVGPVQQLRFSPDGGLVAGASGAAVLLWQASDGKVLQTLSPPSSVSPIQQIHFSPDGSILAALDKEGDLHFWQVEDGSLLYSLEDLKITRFAFSSNGWLGILAGDQLSLYGVSQ